MKNKELLLSLLALTVLTSCGNTIGGLKKGDDILNGTIIENNFEEVEEKEEINTLVQSKLGEVSFDSEEILRYYSCGVIATINKETNMTIFYYIILNPSFFKLIMKEKE